MQMDWQSRTGSQRKHNSDALAVSIKETFCLIVLVDAVESPNSQALARCWAQCCIDDFDTSDFSDPSIVIRKLKQRYLSFRLRFFEERASYTLAIIDIKSRQGWLLFAGDCRAGLKKGDDSIDWLHLPHTLEAQLSLFSSDTPLIEDAHHHLTRSFKGRRFESPEIQRFNWSEKTDFVLCSDGYWREHLQEGIALYELNDDASIFRMSVGALAFTPQSDTANFFIYGF